MAWLSNLVNGTNKSRRHSRRATSSSCISRIRRSAVESLEARHLLAGDLFISEIHVKDLGSDDTPQYFELRGDANYVIPANTYFVVLGADVGTFDDAGEVESYFDLGGITLGSNGYFAFLQGGHPYTVHPDATTLVGTAGFDGAPGSRFHGGSHGGDMISLSDSESYMLIESAVAPSGDVDADNDGVIEAAWTILDSVSLMGSHLGGDPTDVAYGATIIHANGHQGVNPPGSNELFSEFGIDYIARLGASQGAEASDWYGGGVGRDGDRVTQMDAGAGLYPVPFLAAGFDLTHVGTSNAVSTVAGTVFNDDNNDGDQDVGEVGRAGFVAYLDRDGSGTHSNFETTVDPDSVPLGQELGAVFPGVTISGTVASTAGHPPSRATFRVEAEESVAATTGTQTFGVSSATFPYKMEFHIPVSQVIIDANVDTPGFFGASSATIEAYDVDGNLLETATAVIFEEEGVTLSVTRNSAEIAYILAISGSRAHFDNLRFTAPEEYAETDANGLYVINSISRIAAGTYGVRVHAGAPGLSATFEATPTSVNYVDFGVNAGFNPPNHTPPASPPPLVVNGQPIENNPENSNDIVGLSDGVWWIARSDGEEFTNEPLGEWADLKYVDAAVGDFNGDGKDDLVGHAASSGLYVALSTDDGLVASRWGTLDRGQRNFMVGDFNGDGADDVAARVGGSWVVAESDGTKFTNSTWGSWSATAPWQEISTGDFNGDERDDIMGFIGGTWWIAVSDGDSFDNRKFAQYSRRIRWTDILVGDFNGDSRDDVAARGRGGAWWVGLTTGSRFITTHWGRWSDRVQWEYITVGDFNADGMDDIAGRTGGNWWVARSERSLFRTRRWGHWEIGAWKDVVFADFNGDGRTDIAGRKAEKWRVQKATLSGFDDQLWGGWSDDFRFDFVLTGVFGESSSALSDELADSFPDPGPFIPNQGGVNGIVPA